jgi:hypothetical protein
LPDNVIGSIYKHHSLFLILQISLLLSLAAPQESGWRTAMGPASPSPERRTTVNSLPPRLCAIDDPRKGKPVIGMTILTDLKKESDTVWSGGKILDPNNGKVCNAKVTVIDGGKKLEMRGSILFFGRTQT